RLATKSNQIKQLIRNGRSASLQRTFKKSFTSFSHSTRNKTRDGLIRVRNIRALNGRFNTSITHAYSIVIGSKHITLNATGGGRSEERFSRNAETDLVCRLLLEKKKPHVHTHNQTPAPTRHILPSTLRNSASTPTLNTPHRPRLPP